MEEARSTIWLSLSTILTALAASLCCILPLAVAVLGAGSAALGAWLEPWRPVFLAVTVVLLGSAFYREYRKDARCAGSGEECRPVSSSRRRLMLWVVTAFIVALVTFPYYTKPIAAASQGPGGSQVEKAVFHVKGMSCSGCEATVEIAIKKLDGVETVKVSYDEDRAEVSYRPSKVGAQKIQQAIEQLGYQAERVALPAAERTSAPAPRKSASARPELQDLESLDQLAGHFRQTRGQPRIVLLLSPT